MAMKVITRLCDTDQPINGFQALVGMRILVVDPKGRRMCDENIERASIIHFVQQQTRQQAQRPQIGFTLGILICAVRAIADAPAEAADQEFFIAFYFQIQVSAAFHTCQRIIGIVDRVVVAGHVKKRNIQKSEQVLKVGVGQIPAPQNQFDLAKVTALGKAIKAFDNLIADCQDFHNADCALEQGSRQGTSDRNPVFSRKEISPREIH